jgi:hypothetical protein
VFEWHESEHLQKCEKKQFDDGTPKKEKFITYRNKGQLCKECIQKGEEKKAYERGLCRDCYRKDYLTYRCKNKDKLCKECIQKGIEKVVLHRDPCCSCYFKSSRQRRLENILNLAEDQLCSECIQNSERQLVYAKGLCSVCYASKRNEEKNRKLGMNYSKRKIEINSNEFCVKCIEKGKKRPACARGLCNYCNAKENRQRKLENILNLEDNQLCSKCIKDDKKQLAYARSLCVNCYASYRYEEKKRRRKHVNLTEW